MLELSTQSRHHDGSQRVPTPLLPPRTNPQLPRAHATLEEVAAKLNATATAVAAAVDLSKLSGAVVVDPAAPKFTGSITCYVDDATGLVAGLQLGAAPALCSTAGAPRAFSVAADSYVSTVKVAVDPKTGLVGQMLFTVKSKSSLVPTNVVTCGTVAGVPVPLTPPLSALSSLSATCAPAPAGAAGRRLAQASSFIVPGSLRATVTTPGTEVVLSNIQAYIEQGFNTLGYFSINAANPLAYTFTTPASGTYKLVSASLLLSAQNGWSSPCSVQIQTVASNLPTGTVVGNTATATVSNGATTLVPFTGLAATLSPSTTYATVLQCNGNQGFVSWYFSTGSKDFTGVFTRGDIAFSTGSGWAVYPFYGLGLELSARELGHGLDHLLRG